MGIPDGLGSPDGRPTSLNAGFTFRKEGILVRCASSVSEAEEPPLLLGKRDEGIGICEVVAVNARGTGEDCKLWEPDINSFGRGILVRSNLCADMMYDQLEPCVLGLETSFPTKSPLWRDSDSSLIRDSKLH